MKKTHKILMPSMAPIHFEFLKNVFYHEGYQIELLTREGQAVVDEGLKYVHNDTCYPALLVIGQFIDALNSGKYQPDRTALIITQTGGGCRASNYIFLLKKALIKAGYENIPVIPFNLSNFTKADGLKLTLKIIRKLIAAVFYGDILMLLSNQTKPYESNKGDTQKLIEFFIEDISKQFEKGKGYNAKHLAENFKIIARSFSELKMIKTDKIKVGIVGEIYAKYASLANNGLEEFLLQENCEIMIPGMLGFILY